MWQHPSEEGEEQHHIFRPFREKFVRAHYLSLPSSPPVSVSFFFSSIGGRVGPTVNFIALRKRRRREREKEQFSKRKEKEGEERRGELSQPVDVSLSAVASLLPKGWVG